MNLPAINAFALLLAVGTHVAQAKESDTFSDRLYMQEHLADGLDALDAHLREKMEKVARELTDRRARTQDERNSVYFKYFQHPLLPEMLCQVENWIKGSGKIQRYELDGRGIYGGPIRYDDVFLAWFVGIAPVIRLNQVLVGLDKIGHFFGQGWQYFLEDLRLRKAEPRLTESERWEKVREYGSGLEKRRLGYTNDGVFSMGDMAVNWNGFQFHLRLLDRPNSYLRFDDSTGAYTVGTPFTFREYVTDDWDEVLNPSLAHSRELWLKIRYNAQTPVSEGGTGVCEAYRKDPKKFMGNKIPGASVKVYLPATDYGMPSSKLALKIERLCAQ